MSEQSSVQLSYFGGYPVVYLSLKSLLSLILTLLLLLMLLHLLLSVHGSDVVRISIAFVRQLI